MLVVLLNNYLCKLSFTSPFTEISGQANVRKKSINILENIVIVFACIEGDYAGHFLTISIAMYINCNTS